MTKFPSDEYDEAFTNFILKAFPDFLKKIEGTLKLKGHKYLLSNYMTLADIYLAGLFFAFPYDETEEHCHIMQSVVEKFPKVQQYVQTLLNEF